MTENKPIIIHGIDVSECEQITYKNSLNPMCGNTGICCYGRKNCYFKQLARKTQECEELKSVRDSWLSKCEQETKIKEFYQDEFDRKMQELEQLQKDYLLDHRDDDENTIPLIQQIRDRLDLVDELEAEYEELKLKNKKLKQLFRFEEGCKNIVIRELDQLKAENEKYKKKFQEFFNIDNQECWNAAFLQDEKAKAEQKLERIREFATALCYTVMSDGVVILQKDILKIIDEVQNE